MCPQVLLCLTHCYIWVAGSQQKHNHVHSGGGLPGPDVPQGPPCHLGRERFTPNQSAAPGSARSCSCCCTRLLLKEKDVRRRQLRLRPRHIIHPSIHSFFNSFILMCAACLCFPLGSTTNTHTHTPCKHTQTSQFSVGAAETLYEHNIWRLQVPPIFNYSDHQSGPSPAH